MYYLLLFLLLISSLLLIIYNYPRDLDESDDIGTKSVALGGVSKELAITSDVADIADQLKSAIEEVLNTKLNIFKPTNYATQVVAGLIFYIKINTGNDCFNHESHKVDCNSTDSSNIIIAKVYKDLGQHLSLVSVLTGKEAEKDIHYFD